jgi:hypothetical protein
VEIVTRNADIYRKLYGTLSGAVAAKDPSLAKSPARTPKSSVKAVQAKPIRGANVESRKTGTSSGQ